jgi:hypothetical protein
LKNCVIETPDLQCFPVNPQRREKTDSAEAFILPGQVPVTEPMLLAFPNNAFPPLRDRRRGADFGQPNAGYLFHWMKNFTLIFLN